MNVNVDGGGKEVIADAAVHVTDMKGGIFEGRDKDYRGTIYRFDRGAGDLITAEFSIGVIKTHRCGQALYCEDIGPMSEIRDIFDVALVKGPEFHNITDINFNQYENFVAGVTEQGLLFDNCTSVWGDKIAVGGDTDVPPAEFRNSKHVFMNALYLGGSNTDVVVLDNVKKTMFQIMTN